MMFIRPFTISGIAIALLQIWVAGYLYFLADSDQPRLRRLNRQFAFVLFGFAVITVHQNVLVLSESFAIDWTQYLRNFEVMLVLGGGARLCYMLNATMDDHFSAEQPRVTHIYIVLLAVEAGYTAMRLSTGFSSGAIAARPMWLQLPMVVVQLWLLLLVGRSTAYFERPYRAPQTSTAVHWWRTLSQPRSRAARFYLTVILAVLFSFGILAIFLFVPTTGAGPLLANVSDGITILITIVATFAYLRFQLDTLGLELRNTAVGLALFLTSSGTLGWLIATVFLRQSVPGVPILTVLGSINDPNFELLPNYLGVVQQLHELLLPLLWFQIIGSLVFIFGYRLYYRSYLAPAFDVLIDGIEHIERGQLAHQIEGVWRDEFGRIASAFNNMSENLLQTNQELSRYQSELEQMVAKRTQQLQSEIDHRKEIELRAVIQQERARIARDAHDGVLQNLLALRMRLRSRRLRPRNQPALAQELDELAEEVLVSTRELRQLIYDAQTDWGTTHLEEALHMIAHRFRKAYPISLSLQVPPDLAPLAPAQHISVLRIVQEGLANIGRHSQATNCCVELIEMADEQTLCVRITDDGVGVDSQNGSSSNSGLSNMRERARQLGGSMTVGALDATSTAVQRGTRIEIVFPR